MDHAVIESLAHRRRVLQQAAQNLVSAGTDPPLIRVRAPNPTKTIRRTRSWTRWESVMARDASEALGAQQLAGVVVMPRGHAWQHPRVHAGLAGAVAGEAIAAAARKHARAHTSETPQVSRSAFLAVTDRKVALLRLGTGGVKNGRPSEVLARVPRSDVASAWP